MPLEQMLNCKFGNVQVGQIAILSNPLELRSDHFPGWLCQPGNQGIPIRMVQWVDGAGSPPKYVVI